MKRLTEKTLNLGKLLSVAGFIESTLIQIYSHFFLASAPSWTEEVAGFFLSLR